jgi:hypothetical protein
MNFDVASFSSWSKPICNIETGIMRIRSPSRTTCSRCSPRYPQYDWVDNRLGCTRNQVLGRSQSLEYKHFTVKINICIHPELWITNKSGQKAEDWLNLLPYSEPLCTQPLTSYQVQIIHLANVQMRQCTLRKEAYYIIWESELAATLQDA